MATDLALRVWNPIGNPQGLMHRNDEGARPGEQLRNTKKSHWISRFPAKFPLNPMDLERFSEPWSIWDNSLNLIMGTRAWTGGPLKGTEGSWRAQSLGLVNRKTSFCGPPLKPGTLHMLRVLTSQTCFDRTNKSTGFTPFLCTFPMNMPELFHN